MACIIAYYPNVTPYSIADHKLRSKHTASMRLVAQADAIRYFAETEPIESSLAFGSLSMMEESSGTSAWKSGVGSNGRIWSTWGAGRKYI